jgi:hypothetical protein
MVLSLAFKASRTILSIDQDDIKSIQSVRSAPQVAQRSAPPNNRCRHRLRHSKAGQWHDTADGCGIFLALI